MPRIYQAHENAAASPASTTANSQQSPGHRRPVAGQLKNVCVPSARPLPASSPCGFRDGGKQRLRQFWQLVLDERNTATSSPSQQHLQVTPDRADLKAGSSFVPFVDQCRQPFAIIQPMEIASRQASELPQHIKPCVPIAEHMHLGLMQARPLPAEMSPHVGSAVVKPASEHCQQQFGIPAPMNTPSPSSRIPRISRACSTAHSQQQVGSCIETLHSSPSVGSTLSCARLGPCAGDRACEPQEAATASVATLTDASQTKMCAPQKSRKSIVPSVGHEYGDTSLSSSSSYSPLPPFELHFFSPDFEKYRSPFKDCVEDYKSPILQYDDSSPELTPPRVTTTDAKKNVAIPLPDSPAHYNAPEPCCSADNFILPSSVTLRKRRATKYISPLAVSEYSPKCPTERVELSPEQATQDELEEPKLEESKGPGNNASCSGQALTIPKFLSPDISAYRRLIREEIAKCYDVYMGSPSPSIDSPASTASAASLENNVASSPTAATPSASSSSTLAAAFAGLFPQPTPSSISRPMPHVQRRLSTVLECTETSVKGSLTTALWPPLGEIEESLIANARQPTLIDGNFSAASPSMAVCLGEEVEQDSQELLSDSLASFMKHEQSILLAENDIDTPKSTS
ncbi:uncharacterized protein [Dermacentor andersoni]|uniref:uncharacterized protein isoform X2 n=1 Tax=Dermacentor andersoni TaxID=34620 RepID=UPI002155CB2E|nr:uncharacterized protein LOC126522364 isoform X2 [Dermacentor andersoni]